MAITLGSLNINNGSTYFVLNKGVNLGTNQTTFDEVPNYSGAANAQTNVQRGHLIKMTIPMMVKGTSVSNLLSNLNSLWTEVDKATNTLTWDSESFTIVYSSRPETIERDEFFQLGFQARFTLELMREPT
jgi:hypothetical protein